MGTVAADQCNELLPPRRGAVLAITVDSTARAYDLSALELGGVTPDADMKSRNQLTLWMQAETNDVYFHFAGGALTLVGTDVDDVSDTAAVTAGGSPVFANTYCAVLKAGTQPMGFRIDRRVDRFLVVKAASSSGIVRLWAASTST